MIEFNTELKPWEKTIVQKYPLVYLEPNINLRRWYNEEKFLSLIADPNFSNLRYGFECQSGWADLIDKFSKVAQDLVSHLRNSGIQPDAYINAMIFKENYGILCWQGDNNLIEPFKTLFRAYTIEIEKQSTKICENTGQDGCLCVRGHWYKTLSRSEGKRLEYVPVNARDKDYWAYLDNKEIQELV